MSAGERRTFEDIERRAQEIQRAEQDAIHTLAVCLRELAVALPEGSALVYDFAKMAKFVDIMNTGRDPGSALILDTQLLVRRYAERRAQIEADFR